MVRLQQWWSLSGHQPRPGTGRCHGTVQLQNPVSLPPPDQILLRGTLLQRSHILRKFINISLRAIKGWTTTIPLAPGCMCATTLGPIPTTSIAQLTSGTMCNPSISSAAPLYSISSLGSGGTGDGLAIPYCVISGTKVPEVTQAVGQCYGHGDCPVGAYIEGGGNGHPSCP